jgi:hypothetical protein
MANAKTSLFPLPDTQVIETVYVRLDDGRIVARSSEELLELDPTLMATAIVAKSAT